MDNICTHEGCEREIHSNGKCVLHCDKSKFEKEYDYITFFNVFTNYLIDTCSKSIQLADQNNRKSELKLLFQGSNIKSHYKSNLSNMTVTLQSIKFPSDNSVYSYPPFFKYFKGVYFDHCYFHFSRIENVGNTEFFFDTCEFKENWEITPLQMLESKLGLGFIYENCTFHKGVTNNNPQLQIKGRSVIEGNIFYLCKFLEKIAFYGVEFNGLLFSKQSRESNQIKLIELNNCKLKDKFYLNSFNIGKFVSQDSIFMKKFEFKNNNVFELEINNSNFSEVTDFFKSYFNYFEISRSIFEDFVGFEQCIFGIEINEIEHKSTKEGSRKAKYNYTTFKKNNNFRDTVFLKGLDLRNINPNQQPNFLGTYINPENTNRETFRIVKYSFDAVGNHIEANKFYSMEMEAYKRELNENIFNSAKENIVNIKSKHEIISKIIPLKITILILVFLRKIFCRDSWVFKISKLSSNFSANWLIPLIWLLFVSLIFFSLENQNKISFNINSFTKEDWVLNLKEFFHYANFFLTNPKNTYKIYYWIPHRVISLYLIYQFIIAARRQTKR